MPQVFRKQWERPTALLLRARRAFSLQVPRVRLRMGDAPIRLYRARIIDGGAFGRQVMKHFEIRCDTSLGKKLGNIEAAHVFEAACIAAREFFKKPAAFRISGWGGAAGTFQAADKLVSESAALQGETFYVKEIKA